MKKKSLKLGVLAVLLGASVLSAPADKLYAQNLQASPYSKFAFGTPVETTPTAYKGMGGVGIAMRSDKYINTLNPAGYAATDSLSFLLDIALTTNTTLYRSGELRKRTFLGGLDYLAVQFPLYRNKVALSAGVVPFSNAGFTLSSGSAIDNDDINTIKQYYTGSGSLQSAYIGLGIRVLKGLSVGVNARYMFGELDYTTQVVPSSPVMSQLLSAHTLKISDFAFDLGVQETIPISKERELTIGATFAPSTSLTPKRSFTHNLNYGSAKQPELVTTKSNVSTRLPMKLGLGVAYNRINKLILSTDVQMSKWGGVPNIFDGDKVLLKDAYRVALGAEYFPDVYSRRFWNRVKYRAGLSYTTSYTDVAPVGKLDRVVGAIGFGIPVFVNDERPSYVDFSLEYIKALPSVAKVLDEDCIRLSMSINFNETWFRKLKIY